MNASSYASGSLVLKNLKESLTRADEAGKSENKEPDTELEMGATTVKSDGGPLSQPKPKIFETREIYQAVMAPYLWWFKLFGITRTFGLKSFVFVVLQVMIDQYQNIQFI